MNVYPCTAIALCLQILINAQRIAVAQGVSMSCRKYDTVCSNIIAGNFSSGLKGNFAECITAAGYLTCTRKIYFIKYIIDVPNISSASAITENHVVIGLCTPGEISPSIVCKSYNRTAGAQCKIS